MEINSLIIPIALLCLFIVTPIIVFSPTIALVLFLLIPVIKPHLVIYMPFLVGAVGFMLDSAVACAALLSILIHYWRTGEKIRLLIPKSIWLLWFGLILLMWIRLPASHDIGYGIQKALIFSIYNTIVFLIGAIYCSSFKGASKLMSALILTGIISTFGLLIFGQPTQEYTGARISIGYGNVLSIADSISYAVIIFMTFWLSKRKHFLRKLSFPFVAFALFSILIAGARGAILGLLVVSIFIINSYKKERIFMIAATSVLLMAIVAIVLHYFFLTAQSGRFSEERINKSVEDRIELAKLVLSEGLKSPVFGTGTGDTSFQLTGSLNTHRYPHNIYLEVFNELGIVGFVIYAALLVPVFRIFRTSTARYMSGFMFKDYLIVLVSCLLYHLLFGLKASSYAASSMLYFFLAAGISLTKLCRDYFAECDTYYDEPENLSIEEQA
jgi:O-antigen ligase